MHQNAIGIPARSVLPRLGPGHRRFQELGDVSHGEIQIGDLAAVHLDFLLGNTRLETGLNIRNPRHIFDLFRYPLNQVSQNLQIESPNLDGQPFITTQNSFQQELPLRCTDTDLHAGNPVF